MRFCSQRKKERNTGYGNATTRSDSSSPSLYRVKLRGCKRYIVAEETTKSECPAGIGCATTCGTGTGTMHNRLPLSMGTKETPGDGVVGRVRFFFLSTRD